MKTLKNIFAIVLLATFFASCTPTTDINEDTPTEVNLTGDGSDSDQDDGKD